MKTISPICRKLYSLYISLQISVNFIFSLFFADNFVQYTDSKLLFQIDKKMGYSRKKIARPHRGGKLSSSKKSGIPSRILLIFHGIPEPWASFFEKCWIFGDFGDNFLENMDFFLKKLWNSKARCSQTRSSKRLRSLALVNLELIDDMSS